MSQQGEQRGVFTRPRFVLQISDVEKILGVVHTENLQVSAEAYEIALDISPGGNQQPFLSFTVFFCISFF